MRRNPEVKRMSFESRSTIDRHRTDPADARTAVLARCSAFAVVVAPRARSGQSDRMTADGRDSLPGRTCGNCGGQVTGWPYASVPKPDGTSAYFHDGCQPWRHPDVPLGAEEMGPVPEEWRPAIVDLVNRLVAKDYAGLARDGHVSYTDDPDDTTIGTWIEEYPATLVPLPDEAWEHAERGRWINLPNAWWVIVDLWTAEEGRSDLSMEATVRELGEQLAFVIDNVHVM
jgi:hypothetical protein